MINQSGFIAGACSVCLGVMLSTLLPGVASAAVGGETCDDAICLGPAALPLEVTGGVAGMVDDYHFKQHINTCAGGGVTNSLTGIGGDIVYRFRPSRTCEVRVTMTPISGAVNLALYVLRGCENYTASCVKVSDSGGPGVSESIVLQVVRDSIYYIVIDGNGGHNGFFHLNIAEDSTNLGCSALPCDGTFCLCETTVTSYPYLAYFEAAQICSHAFCSTQCDVLGDWLNTPLDDFDWYVDTGSTPTADTGPVIDFMPGTANGKYAYVEATGCTNSDAVLLSACFDFTTLINPDMTFGYHMAGACASELHLDVSVDDCQGWNRELTISGPQQAKPSDPWRVQAASLTQYAGLSRVRMRFVAETGGCEASDIAIDGVRVGELAFGACCHPNETCELLREIECSVAGGSYQGDGVTCSPDPCSTPVGACCMPNGECRDKVDAITCEKDGGDYLGDSTECGVLECNTLVKAFSRRKHLTTVYDLGIPLNGVLIEPRVNGSESGLVLTYDKPVPELACGDITVVNGTCNAVKADGVTLSISMTFDRNACVNVTVGDDVLRVLTHEGNVDQNAAVNILDLQQIKNRLLQPVSGSTAKYDVNTSGGAVNILDLQLTKNNLLQPATCP